MALAGREERVFLHFCRRRVRATSAHIFRLEVHGPYSAQQVPRRSLRARVSFCTFNQQKQFLLTFFLERGLWCKCSTTLATSPRTTKCASHSSWKILDVSAAARISCSFSRTSSTTPRWTAKFKKSTKIVFDHFLKCTEADIKLKETMFLIIFCFWSNDFYFRFSRTKGDSCFRHFGQYKHRCTCFENPSRIPSEGIPGLPPLDQVQNCLKNSSKIVFDSFLCSLECALGDHYLLANG